jgi:hypothetical protein
VSSASGAHGNASSVRFALYLPDRSSDTPFGPTRIEVSIDDSKVGSQLHILSSRAVQLESISECGRLVLESRWLLGRSTSRLSSVRVASFC